MEGNTPADRQASMLSGHVQYAKGAAEATVSSMPFILTSSLSDWGAPVTASVVDYAVVVCLCIEEIEATTIPSRVFDRCLREKRVDEAQR